MTTEKRDTFTAESTARMDSLLQKVMLSKRCTKGKFIYLRLVVYNY